ncbi:MULTISPECIES: glycosyltransferase family 2 protein [unclassified Aureimonas]|uniref:glycosyltransferase family 2 protein n=1 Tax=unclassified Aureimonas TaxID=2615206 RepID=UPI0006F58F11|nr:MULTISPECIES: glycosyltransferase family 2 protein [unclassified Aureimonas]KQT61273.1 hypothetical protein ASG54_24360 [Aureimonas sp. Leaf460]KQT68722.1 hypothetical protein ASG62_19120 [Aureimonas sp. Leaf427]
MDPTTAGQTLRLDDREAHAGSLTLAATRLLRAGQPRKAFELADRRCRMDAPPGPADRAIRALAGRLAGWPFWQEDLDAALRADPLDPTVNATLLRLGSPAARREAALRLVATPDASAHALEDALAHLFEAGERAALRLDLVDDRLSGWIAWTGAGASVLELEGPGEPHRLALTPSAAALPFLPPGSQAALIETRLPFERVRRAVLRIDGALVAETPLVGRSRRGDGPLKGTAPQTVPPRAPLLVLVPVYEDFEASAACIEAAIAETGGRPATRLLVVDDASPNPELARHLRALAEQGRIELKRNEINLGFTGAVRRGLAEAGQSDVLLLNADAILPSGALDRLSAAAYGAPDIGTVTPLSNNGEYTSFPRPGLANPALPPEEAARIDAVAGRLDPFPVDLPTGTGFCLYLRHDARAAVGEMPSIYGRGYFEDMEFCLRAREAGFRSVCAPSLYVTHHGSLSFGTEKAALVSKNLRILRQRFPATRADCAAYVEADPLRAARAAIEAELGFGPSLPLLVAREGGALLPVRLADHSAGALQLLWSSASGRPSARLLGPGGTAPQSLRFGLDEDGAARLGAYLAAVSIERIELLGADPLPPGLLAALGSTTAAIDLVFGDIPLGAHSPEGALLAPFAVAQTRLAPRLRHAIAAETQSFTLLTEAPDLPAGMSVVDARPAPEPEPARPRSRPADAPASLGLLCPQPMPGADAFARALSGLLHVRAPLARIVLLGRAMDDLGLIARGNIAVTGAFAPHEAADLLRLLGIDALVLPPASPFLAEAERMASAHALPLAAADWTFGQLLPAPSSLLLDRSDRDAGNALATADWFAHRLQAAAA